MQFFGNSGARWIIEDNYFAKGGEGELYRLAGYQDSVAKVYKEGAMNPTRQEKLIYMSSIYSSERLQQLAWPKDVLKDAYGNVKGFVMRRFDATKDMADLLDGTGTDSGSASQMDWRKRVVVALNLSYLVNEIHTLGQVIGDMNPKNFGVDMSNGFVCAFDTDSFHLHDEKTGKWYPCTVLDEHYIAPEFQARLQQGGRVDSFRPEETFTRETDHFALAVLIFQLLFNGVHPFTAARVPSRGSSVVIHTREINIYQRMCPFFNPSPNTTIPVYAPPLSIVPGNIQAMFKKAFLEDARPTAQEWAAALSALILQTEKCPKGHYYGHYNSRCPWCALEEKMKQMRNAAASASSTNRASTSGASSSSTGTAAVSGTGTSPTSTTTAAQPPNTKSPAHAASSSAAVQAKKKKGGYIFAAIVIFFLAVYAFSDSGSHTGNSARTGNGTASNQISQGTRKTAEPATKPTAKPTEIPRQRDFAFNSSFSATDGVVRISWSDSNRRSPYTVTFQNINVSSSAQQTVYSLGTTYSTSMDCSYLIPGSQYRIIVTDADGASIIRSYTCNPARTFSDGKLDAAEIKFSIAPRSISASDMKNGNWKSAKPCNFSAATMGSNIRANSNHYGLYTKIAFPPLSHSRTYRVLFAYYASNGYVDSYAQEVTFDRSYSAYYWDVYTTAFFDNLYEKFGKIPTGKYTVKLFFNGQSVSSQSFSVT